METLKYKVIRTDQQYLKYCDILDKIVFSKGKKSAEQEEEIALLTLLIETYDEEQRDYPLLDPVEVLAVLMAEQNVKAVDLATELGVTKGYISQILNYRKTIPKDVVRKLADKFNVRQEVLNRSYRLRKTKKKKAA